MDGIWDRCFSIQDRLMIELGYKADSGFKGDNDEPLIDVDNDEDVVFDFKKVADYIKKLINKKFPDWIQRTTEFIKKGWK